MTAFQNHVTPKSPLFKTGSWCKKCCWRRVFPAGVNCELQTTCNQSAPLFCAKKTERYTCLVCVSTMLYMCGLLTSKTYLSFVPRFRYLRPPFKTSKVEGSTSKRRFPSIQICLPDIFWTQKWTDVRRQEGLGKECSLSECTWSYLSH